MSYHNTIQAISSIQHQWQSTEASGTSIADSVGTLTGTLAGSPTTVTLAATSGVDGLQPSFSGSLTSGYWSAGTTGLATGSTTRSLACWFRTTANQSDPNSSGYIGMLGYGTGASNQLWSLFCKTDNTTVLIGDFGTNLLWTRGIGFNDGFWHYLCATYDGTTAKLYFDGVLVASKTVTYSTTIGTNPFWVGRMISTNGPFTGNLGEIEIYSAAISASQVASNYAAGAAIYVPTSPIRTKPVTSVLQPAWSTGMVAGYDLNETSGTATDLVGAHPGTLVGSTSWGTGTYGNELHCADDVVTSCYCELHDIPALDGATALTMAFLLKLDTYANTQDSSGLRHVFSGEGTTGADTEMRLVWALADATLVWQLGADSAYPLLVAPNLPLNQYVLVTVRLASNVRSIWYGATKVAERTDSGIAYPSSKSNSKGLAGSPYNHLRNWSGSIVTAPIWTVALTDGQITALAADPFAWNRFPVFRRTLSSRVGSRN